jgi:hypothetical protein
MLEEFRVWQQVAQAQELSVQLRLEILRSIRRVYDLGLMVNRDADIDGFVVWGDTPQGHRYWAAVRDLITNGAQPKQEEKKYAAIYE